MSASKVDRRTFLLAAATAAAGVAAGCTGTAGSAGSADEAGSAESAGVAVDATDESTVEELEEAIEDAGYAVAMITDVGGVNDQSFNQLAWEGLQQFEQETGLPVSYFESAEGADGADYAGSLEVAVEMGNTLVWGIGYATADAVAAAAEEYGNVSFAVIDSAFDEPASNLTGVTFRAQEACFAVGYIAARCTATGRLGFVGGVSSDALDAFEYGFRAGVAWAGAQDGAEAQVAAAYAGSFDDESAGKTAATALYEGGCDIVFHAAGNAGNGVIEAAVEAGALVIGVDDDQYSLAPENMLSSALKRVDEAVCEVSTQAANGEAIGGANIELGATEGAVGISEHHDLMDEEVYEAALALIELIKDGDLVPPVDGVEYQQFVAELSA